MKCQSQSGQNPKQLQVRRRGPPGSNKEGLPEGSPNKIKHPPVAERGCNIVGALGIDMTCRFVLYCSVLGVSRGKTFFRSM